MSSDNIPHLPMRHKDPKRIGDWKIGRTIGKGASGRVRIARHAKSGQYAAIKIVSKSILTTSVPTSLHAAASTSERILGAVEREIVIMKLIDHPNIMRLYDVWETSTHLYLILEYVEGGELFDYLCEKGALSSEEALGYFQQIVAAVDYCHRFNIAHRDLKPENLLLDKEKNIKVADFGMAAWQSTSHNAGLLKTSCGSPHYAAPEVIRGQAYNGSMADTWSCGVILYAVLTGQLPFDDEDLHKLLEKVQEAAFEMPTDLDPLAQDLISKMLRKDVASRITIAQVMKHPFFLSRPIKKSNATGGGVIPSIERPMDSVTSIDPDIFENLRTLWNGTPDEEIKERLENGERTWEKGVYWLLVEFRTKRRERIGREREKEKQRVKYRAKKELREKDERKGMAVISEETTSVMSIPVRVSPPTPRRASGMDSNPSENSLSPQIVLDAHTASSSIHSPFPSGAPTTPLTLDIPSQFMQDQTVQTFFAQIVDHLNVIQARGPNNLSPGMDGHFETVSGSRRKWSMTAEINSPQPQETPTYPTPVREPLTIQTNGLFRNAPLLHHPFSRPPQDDRNVQIMAGPRPSKLHKKNAVTEPICSPAFSLSPGSSPISPSEPWSPSSPTKLWFPFKTRNTTYTLGSFHSALTTRNECRRLLMNVGCDVVLTDAEGLGVLKCKRGGVRESKRGVGVAKGVKFRVEVVAHSAVTEKGKGKEKNQGWEVEMRFVLEKGSLDTFRNVIGRVREEWVLDSLDVDGVA